MAKKQAPKPIAKPAPQGSKPVEGKARPSTGDKSPFMARLAPYFPGIALFAIAFIVTLVTYKDYGICWDEPGQRLPGLLSYNYVFHGSQDLFLTANDNHGAGFEMVLMIIEKWLDLTDTRDIYLMRHLVTDVFFLISVLAGYVLVYRLFRNKFVACIGFLMLLLTPRIYAHSFFNSKDIPFMAMITISLAYCQYAFEKNRTSLYFVLGILVGYATSIRIMGIMLGGMVFFFLLIDMFTGPDKADRKKPLKNIALFSVGFVLFVYLGWPYLWKHPIDNFIESYTHLSHFDFRGSNLINGKYEVASKLPWTYFPIWFLISNPEIWLITGFAGILWLIVDFFKKPLTFFRNTTDRNFLLYFVCFAAPIFAVIFLHSVIYDDWRHLYFVYPAFVLMATYFINKIYQTRYKMVIQGACVLEVAATGLFMVSNHPYNQVYFNYFVSHAPEYLRKNYELDYWGCTFKQGLEYLLAKYPSGVIKIYCNNRVFYDNNIMLMPEEERGRIQLAPDPESADFFITNFRGHPYDYPSNKVEFSITVLNSTVLCIYKEEKDPVKQKQMRDAEITDLVKALAANPNDCDLHARIGDAYFRDGQYDSAEAHHMRALHINPESIVINDMAGEYFGKKRYQQAIDFCREAIRLNPVDVNPYTNMALCYMRLSQFDSALHNLNKSVSIDPKYNVNYISLAITYKAIGNMDSAKKYEAIAQKSYPNFKL